MKFDCLKELEENSDDIYNDVYSVLICIVENVIKYPENPKYRRLRLNNAIVSMKLLPAIGGMECLFAIGFKEDDDALLLPNDVPVHNLQNFHDEIKLRKTLRDKGIRKSKPESGNIMVSELKPNSVSADSLPDSKESIEVGKENNVSTSKETSRETKSQASTSNVSGNEGNNISKVFQSNPFIFLAKIEELSKGMHIYEDSRLQQKALEAMPLSKFQKNIELEMEKRKNATVDESIMPNNELSYQEMMLSELLEWFKTSFFQWVNAPDCSYCSTPTKYVSNMPSLDKSIGTIEVYTCIKCQRTEFFPRYNDLGILLQSRKGRCGEWTNCFILFCRALKWDTRYINDGLDHVWVEVYSTRQKRWLHCDPCENALDTPLMYEEGWGKKLSYVFAYSCEEVQDVTWRYTSQHQEVCKRRNAVSEQDLLNKILSITKRRQAALSPERKKILLHRQLSELVEFLVPPKATEEYGGRSSGSEAWRLARGEMKPKERILETHHVWNPGPLAVKQLKFQIEYSTALDKYVDRVDHKELQGWESGVYSAESIFRKREFDWKAVYLARSEGSDEGKIEWSFDFGSKRVAIDEISIECPVTLFSKASVKWTICNDLECISIPEGSSKLESKEFSGSEKLKITALLSNGEGKIAWQHAQLFRQSLDSTDFIFKVFFSLKPLDR